MPITINGTTGISGVDGSAAAPPVTGTDTDTGVFFPSANTVALTTGGTERLRITSAGNVGIGTASPTQKFEVVGQILASGSSDLGLLCVTSGASTSYAQFQNSVRNWQIRNEAAGNFTIRDNNASAVRLSIDTSGLITQINATSGSGNIAGEQTFRLAADGPATTQNVFADFFGATSSISLEASSTYEIVAYAAFLKTTAGSTVWQMLASSAPTRMQGWFIGSPTSGIGQATIATGTSGVAGSQASTFAAFGPTASLSTGVNHNVQITMLVQTNLATNFRLQLNTVTGTGTPLAGSYYRVKKISATTGTFV